MAGDRGGEGGGAISDWSTQFNRKNESGQMHTVCESINLLDWSRPNSTFDECQWSHSSFSESPTDGEGGGTSPD